MEEAQKNDLGTVGELKAKNRKFADEKRGAEELPKYNIKKHEIGWVGLIIGILKNVLLGLDNDVVN